MQLADESSILESQEEFDLARTMLVILADAWKGSSAMFGSYDSRACFLCSNPFGKLDAKSLLCSTIHDLFQEV